MRLTVTRIATVAIVLVGVVFGARRLVDSGGHGAAPVAPQRASASSDTSLAAGSDAGAVRSMAAIVHLDPSTADKVGSFGVTGLGSVDVYRARTIDRKQECLLTDAGSVSGASCVDGSLFRLHAAALGVLGFGGTDAAPRREIVAGVVAPGITRIDAAGASGLQRAVPINARGAFVYAPPEATPRDEWPTRLELRDGSGRLIDALAVDAR